MGIQKNFALLAAALFSGLVHANHVAVDVTLSPAGSFVAETSKVTGTAYKTADGVAAENVIVDATTLATGVSLRDKHLKEHLLTEKFPQIKLVKAQGKDGKGKAQVDIMGKRKDVDGTYTVDKDLLKADFKMKLSDLDIKGVRYMTVGVKDDVTIHVEIPIKAKK